MTGNQKGHGGIRIEEAWDREQRRKFTSTGEETPGAGQGLGRHWECGHG